MDTQINCDCSDCNGPRLKGPCLNEINNNMQNEIKKSKNTNSIIRKRNISIDK